MVDLYRSCINVDKALVHLLVILILSHICHWLLMYNLQLEALWQQLRIPCLPDWTFTWNLSPRTLSQQDEC